jgi:hypothetical protein
MNTLFAVSHLQMAEAMPTDGNSHQEIFDVDTSVPEPRIRSSAVRSCQRARNRGRATRNNRVSCIFPDRNKEQNTCKSPPGRAGVFLVNK